MIKTAWHLWTLGEDGLPAKEGAVVCETHVVPEVQRDRHTPIGCWCKPAKDIAIIVTTEGNPTMVEAMGLLEMAKLEWTHPAELDGTQP